MDQAGEVDLINRINDLPEAFHQCMAVKGRQLVYCILNFHSRTAQLHGIRIGNGKIMAVGESMLIVARGI